MDEPTVLTEYFYGDEAEQFTYFRIPRLLITSPRFKGLSTEAKLLYGMMLDRMGLSMKNGWHEPDGRVYIYYTIGEICNDLRCGTEKAVKLVGELDGKARTGVSLIERKRQGQGKPTKIYVKRFTTRAVSTADPPAEHDNHNFQTSEDRNSRISEIEIQDFGESKFKTSGNPNSRLSETETQDFGKSKGNNTDSNKTDINHPYSANPSILPSTDNLAHVHEEREGLTDGQAVRERIKKQIDYDFLPFRLNRWELKQADEMLELMVEVSMNRSPTIRVGRDEFGTPYVQERLRHITIDHIEQVLQGLQENVGRVTNVKAYLLASLFNAAATSYNTASLSVSGG